MKKIILHTPFGILFMFLRSDVNKLEHDPKAQYRFNRFWAIFWFLQMITLPLFIRFFPKYWLVIEFFYVTQASLWANFATHFGAMSSALAAINNDKQIDAVADAIDDVSEDVDDIHEVNEHLHPNLIEDSINQDPALWSIPGK